MSALMEAVAVVDALHTHKAAEHGVEVAEVAVDGLGEDERVEHGVDAVAEDHVEVHVHKVSHGACDGQRCKA